MGTATTGNPDEGSYYSVNPEDVLRFQHERIVTALFTSFLITLEDLGVEHDTALDKLQEKLPQQYKAYVDLADYLDEPKSRLLRKRVLDRGNHALRELNEVLRSFVVTFRQAS